MGVPTSEVGYTAAMPRREDHEVHKGIGPKNKRRLINDKSEDIRKETVLIQSW